MEEPSIGDLVKKAVNGDKSAAEAMIRSVQGKVYGLCLRMLWQREDAQESCQEILIKVVTRLSQFNFNSKFETWVFQIATNHLIDRKRSSPAAKGLTFSDFEEDLLSEQIDPDDSERDSPDFQSQLSEIRISCTTALLQCLEPAQRVSYVLGEILQFEHLEAAIALNVTPSTHRKRLERARGQVESFTREVCGVISPSGKCQCQRRLRYAKSCGKVDLARYPFLSSSENKTDVLDYIQKIELAKRTAEHYRLTGSFDSPDDFSKVLEIISQVK